MKYQDIQIRKFQHGDEEQIMRLHNDTIRGVYGKFCTDEQINVWIEELDFEGWTRLLKAKTYVALADNDIVGFGIVNPKGRITKLYTHKDHQGEGIGSTILEYLEKEVIDVMGLNDIYLDCFVRAKTFYEKNGYQCIKTEMRESESVSLEVCSMKKNLRIS